MLPFGAVLCSWDFTTFSTHHDVLVGKASQHSDRPSLLQNKCSDTAFSAGRNSSENDNS